MVSAEPRLSLSDEKQAELFRLIEGADSVELKLTIPDSDLRSAVSALHLDPLDAEIRQVFFFDTPDLALNKSGLVVRARRVQRKGDDTVVKLRPVDPHELPAKVRAAQGFGVEVDAMPGGFVCSASMKGALDTPAVRDVALGKRTIKKLFSKEQRRFYAEHAPEGVGLDDLSILGPILVLKLKFSPEGINRKFVAELWLYPDGSRVLELSTKSAPGVAFEAAAESRAFLSERGVDLSGEQQTKTKMALEFFAQNLSGRALAATK